jgi:hypothetical protein
MGLRRVLDPARLGRHLGGRRRARDLDRAHLDHGRVRIVAVARDLTALLAGLADFGELLQRRVGDPVTVRRGLELDDCCLDLSRLTGRARTA